MKQRVSIYLRAAVFAAAVTTAWALDSGLPPSGNFDLSHWKLTLPIDSSGGNIGNPIEKSAAQLTAGFTNQFFYTGPIGEMIFWCPADGAKTVGTTYPRAELREMLNPTNDTVNWTGYGTHILDAQCRVTRQPSTKKVIIGQIHGFSGAARPLIKLQFNNGTLEALVKFSPNSDIDTKYTFANVGLSNLIAYQIRLADGLLTVTVNGTAKGTNVFLTDPDWANQTLFFKAGNYVQDNVGTSTNGAVVSFSQLSVSHTGPANLFPPVISPIPTQTINPGANLSLFISATDSDLPPQTLSYLLLNAPAGAALGTNGLFTWTPSVAQAGTTNLIVVSVSDNGSPSLSATQSFTVIVNPGPPCGGLKGDVSPRGNVNGVLTISDWVQIGRFAAGLDIISNACELARADCAPRPCGNNALSIADWVQAGRYVASLDALSQMSDCPLPNGFAADGMPPKSALTAESGLVLTNMTVEEGQTNFLRIWIRSRGDENALQFSLTFDADRLAYTGANLLGEAANAALFLKNTNQVAQGRLGLLLGLNPNRHFRDGLQPIVEVGFRAASGIDPVSTPILFGNQPIACEVVDTNANALPAVYQNGMIAITSGNTLAFQAITLHGNRALTLTLTGTPGAVWDLEESADMQSWRRIATLTNLTGVLEYTNRFTPGSSQQFYRTVRP